MRDPYTQLCILIFLYRTKETSIYPHVLVTPLPQFTVQLFYENILTCEVTVFVIPPPSFETTVFL